MNRRLFVQAGASSLLVSSPMIAAFGDASGRLALQWDYVFYDERFADAQRRVQALSGATTPTAVQGDVTAVWTRQLAQANLTAPLTMAGVTTESFYFCLKVLLTDQARVAAEVRRIDRDLHQWTIRTGHHTTNGPTS